MERPPPLTFVIPIGNYHRDIAERAIQSVLAQSIYCGVVAVYDTECKGAGYARNQGLERVQTPFVAFLDADDWLEPDFAEKCLRAFDGRHYVYTDWIEVGYVTAPCTPWDGRGSAHIITTLLPTIFVRHVGGFDETLPGLEDTDLFWKLTRAGLCGKRLPQALFHYGKGGLRAQAFRDRADRDAISKSIIDRYKGKPMPDNCGGCGATPNPDIPNRPANESFDGAVLTQALWAGNRQQRGTRTGILYPRSGNGKQLWVHPADIDAAPHLFARVVELPPPVTEDDLKAWRQFSAEMHDALGSKAPVVQSPAPAGVVRREAAPDVDRVLRLYQQHT